MKLTKFSKILLGTLLVSVIGVGVYYLAPGLKVSESLTLSNLDLDDDVIDNEVDADFIEIPSTSTNSSVANKPLFRIAGYAWNGETPIIAANGGPRTTKGSLMEANGVNLELVRQDWLSELKAMQLKFIELYDQKETNPHEKSDKAAFAIMMMGDGAPFYISTMQATLDEKFGKDKYHVQVIGAFGMSNGEDKLIGPVEWKTDPQTMLGSLISTVPGDGDWVTALNYAFANNLKVNPDFTTYDPDAVNFFPSADDDYINSAKELIASQTQNFTVELKEVKDGKLTGKTIRKKIDGCATWTPGDKMVFDELTGFTDVASTKEFNNQMATTIIAFKEYALQHDKEVTNILKAALTAANQVKKYDAWARYASNAVQKTFDIETPDYWYEMFKGQTATKAGVTYNMGGTRALNYADAMQYYGLTDGVNRYRSVYTQVSSYLTELNPFDFNANVPNGVIPYDDAVNLYFLKSINDIDAGTVNEFNYTTTRSDILASGEWNINFATGSTEILPSSAHDINSIYNLLVQAENTRVTVIGHTDNTGSYDLNVRLSNGRAQSVVNELLARRIPRDRIQLVDGRGPDEPIASNTTASGRAQNRRVTVTILQ